ncbi:MAG: hypothetical protein H6667_15585 [Ardenticatenaceae bacterium]|nr:hypothetical protein [Ardenticatenaceae bacterium]
MALMSGFPLWTLWGIGLSALGALLATILAYVAQSPQLIARPLFRRLRLGARARTFTGYALASLLLAAGFFLAGVPIEPEGVAEATAVAAFTPSPNFATPTILEEETAVPTLVTRTGQSGAFSGPPPAANEDGETAVPVTTTPESGNEQPTATSAPLPAGITATPTARILPSSTPTPTPTNTPTPTVTPTPIEGETATLNIGTSTLWLRRSPGGQTLVLVRGDETIILLPGHANQAGILWQQIMTVDGTVGWVQEEFVSREEG